MTDTPPEPGTAASPSDEATELRRLVEGLEVRNSVIARLATNVEKQATEVAKLRRAISDRPTRASVDHRRRVLTVLLLLYGWVIIFMHDQHVENCSSGHQAAVVIDYSVNRPVPPGGKPRPPLTPESVKKVIEDSTPAATCDVTFPLHPHGINPTTYAVGPLELTQWNLLGLLLYGLGGGILYAYQRGPAPDSRHRYYD